MTGPVSPEAPGVDLDELWVDTEMWSDPELEVEGRRVYLQHCVAPATLGSAVTHDGQRVFVYPDTFEHLAYQAATESRRGWAKDDIAEERIQRLRWILPVVAGLVAGTDCWLVTDWGHFKKPPPRQRLYVVNEEGFVIWLREKRDTSAWVLRSAYVATVHDIKRYVKGARKIWNRPARKS